VHARNRHAAFADRSGAAVSPSRKAEIPLPSLKDELAAPQRSTLSEWIKQCELAIVELHEGDAFGIAIKLLVLFFVSHEIGLPR
jgi:hypothetical protein